MVEASFTDYGTGLEDDASSMLISFQVEWTTSRENLMEDTITSVNSVLPSATIPTVVTPFD